MTTHAISSSLSVSQRLTAGVLSLVLGAFLTWGVGMAQGTSLHNAAHDTRHSLGFPCH